MEKLQESKDLDVTSAARGVWLVKVPKYVSDCWKKAGPGSEVGKLVINKTKGAPGKTDTIFTLSEQVLPNAAGKDSDTLPLDHTFNITKVVGNQVLSVLSVEMLASEPTETTSGSAELSFTEGKVCIEGKVIRRAECRPRIDASYMRLNKCRIEQGNKPRREVIQLARAVNTYKPKSAHDNDIEYEMKKKEEGKKTRSDEHVVQDALYSAFEKHQFYNIRDLVSITKQPIAYLKEILKEMCIYNVKAPHRNMWELKPEYRHYNTATTTSSSTTSSSATS